MRLRTRFAPSPTGPLHLGHAYSAILAHDMARAAGGDFVLRIEDIDRSRSRAEWEDLIYKDLSWLGLSWETPVVRQSERLHLYRQTLQSLWNEDLLFACTCNRRDILEAASAPNESEPAVGPDGIVYPGTCRDRKSFGDPVMPTNTALRLDMAKAIDDRPATFEETGRGPEGESGRIDIHPIALPGEIGDVVLARRDMGTSYHLSVVVDDADQGITHVVRGQDLFEATKIHVVLQDILSLPRPEYHHHRLIRDEAGKRLAKRDDARSIQSYRDAGATPDDIRRMVGL
ncbi:tRNA glutamyl-Q(34) synthetase GluQRS [Silicimonas algicola]|uniref:Glutamyl-Q tRNA(Asp) synthetase n=1 Tax=Silicimonas algicola TaxID=1826607 RepID=A0A316G9G3_9RHOB|nr:tRNA glutamyl-Q(34) synthetase GluQRS [Silicimonas algicola]AZQ67527.1 tRNA glutamyl-Q(34) synthetase GluQRS [Silicimonas algicola]PWK57223.1 glutamyl-Q tRNA(Asp) synthetase [Silicimonas algicola]